MDSHPVLSDAELAYITSHRAEDIPKGNISEYRRRIRKKARLAFDDLKKIEESRVLPQSYKDSIFNVDTVSSFLGRMTHYNPENPIEDEQMKQDIATRLIDLGIGYYRQRYPSTFAIARIDETINFLYEIANISRRQATDNRAIDFYHMRGRMTMPPLLNPDPTEWQVLCIMCFKYRSGKTLKDAVTLLRHAKKCSYEEKQFERCLKIIPPLSLSKSSKKRDKETS